MKQFVKDIVFTHTPLNKKFKFEDVFQIYPINLPNAPTHKKTKIFPCILEYWYEPGVTYKIFDSTADVTMSDLTHRGNRSTVIRNLLSCISNFRFFSAFATEPIWAMPVPEEITPEVNNSKSALYLPIYIYPGMPDDLKITEFTNIDVPNVNLIPRRDYYYYDPIESPSKEVTFPEDIDTVLASYFKLSQKEKIVCDSAIYQLCNAIEIQTKMKSLSFLSAVSAIETLVNYRFKAEDKSIKYECNDCKTLQSSARTCNACGKPIWGVAAKFREFLFEFVSNNKGAKKYYNEIYNVRSKIAHTDYLINNENFLNWEFSDQTEKISLLHIGALQLTRRSITGWLVKK
jgi:hypothetical protein